MANRRLDPESAEDTVRWERSRFALLETMMLTAAIPLIGWAINRHDPFFQSSPFPWLVFAPLFAGLRYGFAFGFGSALALFLAQTAAWRLGRIPELPITRGIGLIGVGMVAGEFCDMWRRRLSRLFAINEYRRTRLDEFTRSYHILKVSHDRLEQVFASSTRSLREAITTMNREILAAHFGDGPLFGMEKRIVALFANYTWVQVGSLFAVRPDGKIAPQPLAFIGEPGPIPLDDPLLEEALRHRRLASVRRDASLDERGTNLLAVIPLVDADNRVWGLFAIRNMLFIAFHDDNLKLLAVLGAHIGDILSAGPSALRDDGSPSASEFLRHVRRGIEDRKRFSLPVAIVAFHFPDTAEGKTCSDLVIAQRRSLDHVLPQTTRGGSKAACVLMPLTDKRGVGGYLARLDADLQRRHGADLKSAGVRTKVLHLEKGDRADAVLSLLRSWTEVDETRRILRTGS